MRQSVLALLLVCAPCSVVVAGGQVLYVDENSPNPSFGGSWDQAFHHVSEAIGWAEFVGDVTEIRVAQGTYRPDEQTAWPDGDGDRAHRFTILDGVHYVGGYAGAGGSDPDDWDPDLYTTILSGDLQENDEEFDQMLDNSRHVVWGEDLSVGSKLTGFEIRSGFAPTNILHYGRGGGMYLASAVLELERCRFVNNRAIARGAGLYAENSAIVVTECFFEQNLSSELGVSGGGMCVVDGSASISASLFTANDSLGAGSGGYFIGCDSVGIDNCVISDNSAGVGAGIYLRDVESSSITDTRFAENIGLGAAGAFIAAECGDVTVERCHITSGAAVGIAFGAVVVACESLYMRDTIIAQSQSSFFGGGLSTFAQDAVVINCVFSGNTSVEGGAALFVHGPTRVYNSSFAGNSGESVIHVQEASVSLYNSIVWGNSGPTIAGSTGTVRYCDIEGGWSGSGNIDADPMFVQPSTHDLRLAHGSPCLNAGANSDVPSGVTTDLLGLDRIQDIVVDMGAYEGSYDALPDGAYAPDFDEGEAIMLIPAGGWPAPLEKSFAELTNVSAGDDHEVWAFEYDEPLHLTEDGYLDMGGAMVVHAPGIEPGTVDGIIALAFDASDLEPGVQWFDIDLVTFDASAGVWRVATGMNSTPSPGHTGPIGDRSLAVGDDWDLVSPGDLGDFGVIWDTVNERGAVWAHVDFIGDFALGVPRCVADCAQPPDGAVNFTDLLFLLSFWDSSTWPYDIDHSGAVDFGDLLQLLGFWGACP